MIFLALNAMIIISAKPIEDILEDHNVGAFGESAQNYQNAIKKGGGSKGGKGGKKCG
ncbi:unnamed protein product [Ceutorhynchus assimilis]|nr:unnamed protein product [Ceutorhynchus assimilis]